MKQDVRFFFFTSRINIKRFQTILDPFSVLSSAILRWRNYWSIIASMTVYFDCRVGNKAMQDASESDPTKRADGCVGSRGRNCDG